MIAYIEDLVARNLPDEMARIVRHTRIRIRKKSVIKIKYFQTQSTMDPMYNEFVSKGVVELGYRDTRHFCERWAHGLKDRKNEII